MRTTVTLDPDVERLLKNEAHRRGASFKVALNEAVRKAFRTPSGQTRSSRSFTVKARSMSLRPGLDPARISELADTVEMDAFLAVTSRLREKRG